MGYKIFFICSILISLLSCKNKDHANTKPKNLTPSPFVGIWVSQDNSVNNLFQLRIEQKSDTLLGYHCNYLFENNVSDCNTPGLSQPSFEIMNTDNMAFETSYCSNTSRDTGRLRLSLNNGNLYWQVLDAPTGTHHTWMQTVLEKRAVE